MNGLYCTKPTATCLSQLVLFKPQSAYTTKPSALSILNQDPPWPSDPTSDIRRSGALTSGLRVVLGVSLSTHPLNFRADITRRTKVEIESKLLYTCTPEHLESSPKKGAHHARNWMTTNGPHSKTSLGHCCEHISIIINKEIIHSQIGNVIYFTNLHREGGESKRRVRGECD